MAGRLFWTEKTLTKTFALAPLAAATLACLAATADAGTLVVSWSDPNTHTLESGGYQVSPTVTLGFANSVDYSALANPATGPKFGAADLVFVEWELIENLAYVEKSTSSFVNPVLTQAMFDNLTYVQSRTSNTNANPLIFAPVTGSIANNAYIYFAESSATTFVGGPMVKLTGTHSGTVLTPTGNWDSDTYNDAGPWDFLQTSVSWNPTATSFAAPPSTSEVPLPASLWLMASALGAAGLLRKRKA